MAYKYWHHRICAFCDRECSRYCDNCGRPICDHKHRHTLKLSPVFKVDFCPVCVKKVKPDVKLGGYKITKEALDGKFGGWV